MKDYRHKLLEAQRWLLLKAQVLWATIVVLEKVEDNSFTHAYAWTDGRHLGFNPLLILAISLEELTFVLAHEALHIRLRHHTRRGDRDNALWNDAGDYVINLILKDLGFVIPEGVLLDEKYRGWTTEGVYADLVRQQEEQSRSKQGQSTMNGSMSNTGESEEEETDTEEQAGEDDSKGMADESSADDGINQQEADNASDDSQGNYSQDEADSTGGSSSQISHPENPQGSPSNTPGNTGSPADYTDVSPDTGQQDQVPTKKPSIGEVREIKGTPEEIEQNENLWKTLEIQTEAMLRTCGDSGGNLRRMIEGQTRPVIPWREALLQFLTEWINQGYDWNRRSRRWSYLDYFLPDNRTRDIGFIPCLMDTSGSISDNEMAMFATEIRNFIEQFDRELLLIYVDAQYQCHQWLENGDVIAPQGGGGTDFCPGFEWMEQEGLTPDAAIYLTDGRCDSFPDNPGYNVLWVIVPQGVASFTPPFGEVLYIRDWV